MFKNIFKKYLKTTEDVVTSHKMYGEAYKLVGIVIGGDETFLHDGVSVSKSVATIKLCFKVPLSRDEYIEAWRSPEYKYSNDAENVLIAECRRVSDHLKKRIEIMEYDSHKGDYIVSEVLSPNNPQFLIESTNM